jgi:zinc/manganese transport system substrate-binding protein
MLVRLVLAFTVMLAWPAWPAFPEKLKVIASFSIIEDFARNVGGDHIELTTLVGPDADIHSYQPRPSDAAALARAEVVLVNGLGFEGFILRLMEVGAAQATIVELAEGVRPIEAGQSTHDHDEDEHGVSGHGPFDPHAFQSVSNALIYVDNLAAALCAADPHRCEAYLANAANYGRRLKELDEELRAAAAALPQDRRTLITLHDAFGYFGQAYGLKFMAPQGISTDAEPSAADIAMLIRTIREDGASAIFTESMTDSRLIEQIASETGLRPGGPLYSDALSSPEGPAATYVEMMRANMRAIEEAIRSR